MDFTAIEAFSSVSRYASFSRAAIELHVTQPAVSKRIASLEELLGVTLFNRIGRHVGLTNAGKQLLPAAENLLLQVKEFERQAQSLSERVAGSLSVAVSHHVALYRMPLVIQQFIQRYPQVSLDIRFLDSDAGIRQLEEGEIEFAVVTLPQQFAEDLIAQPVWHDDLRIAVGKQHELAQSANKQVSLEQLSAQSCVLPDASTETFRIIERRMHELGLELKVLMQSNNLQSLKMLIEAGVGWSLLPQSMLDGEVVALNCDMQFERNLGIVLHRKRSRSNAAEAMLQLLHAVSDSAPESDAP